VGVLRRLLPTLATRRSLCARVRATAHCQLPWRLASGSVRSIRGAGSDPTLGSIRRDMFARPNWAAVLEHSFARRASEAPSASVWVPEPCACSLIRETLSLRDYGGYRPLHWWLRSFLAQFANASSALPTTLLWPAMAQFMLPRAAIRFRSREFLLLNARLTEVPAPLKANVRRAPATSDANHQRSAKWANFGPMVVDLGPAPPPTVHAADKRAGINGMDFAQLYERAWFAAFDPALPEARPAHVHCFERAAIELSPMRCAAPACPYTPLPGGCAATDRIGRTSPPSGWRFTPGDAPPTRRCLGGDCITSADEGSAAWATSDAQTAAQMGQSAASPRHRSLISGRAAVVGSALSRVSG
jgi:hypothetical protein